MGEERKLLMVESHGRIDVIEETPECCARLGDIVDYDLKVNTHTIRHQRGTVIRELECCRGDEVHAWICQLADVVADGVRAVWRRIEYTPDE